MNLEILGTTPFIALETYRQNGEGVSTPVWVTEENGKLYIWTRQNSGKVKRIRNNSVVRVARCDMQGNLESDWLEAKARLLDQPEDESRQRQRLEAKYGDQYRTMFGGENQNAMAVLEIQAAPEHERKTS